MKVWKPLVKSVRFEELSVASQNAFRSPTFANKLFNVMKVVFFRLLKLQIC